MKILIIEDNEDMLKTLTSILGSSHLVEVARTGQDGCYKAKTHSYDLVIIDLVLGDMDGIEVCKAIREKHASLPILILTGKYQIASKVAAFNAGADDYVTKPFNKDELLARLRALLRRPAANPEMPSLTLGPLVLHGANRTVEYNNQPIVLRKKEFNLLEYMIRHQGQVITRSMILDHVWESDVNHVSNTVDVHVNYLREKIDRRFNIRLIRTVPGMGYKIELDEEERR